jgi:spore germination protein KA
MGDFELQSRINEILNEISNTSPVVRNFIIGKITPMDAAILYLDGMVDKNIIDRDVLRPLMFGVEEDISGQQNVSDYLCRRYIAMSNTVVEGDNLKARYYLKRGKTILLLNNVEKFIIIDTTGGMYRSITEPEIESSIRGTREGFVENIEVNISMIKRKIKEKNLAVEILAVGTRTQTDLALMYIDDIVDKDILNNIRERLQAIDIDGAFSTGTIMQCVEDYSYTIFPQLFGTQKPDVVSANLLEGRIAIILEGSPYVITLPAVLPEFFQSVEDYYQRTMQGSFARVLRVLAVFTVVSLPAIYLSLTKFNSELIPVKFVIPIVQSRKGIALTPFMEILSILFVVEILREGGLRLPSKIAQTLSVVGGFIIGNAALEARLVSSTTLLIVGVTTIASFVIPNYEMALSIRLLTYPMLLIANILGVLGIAVGSYLLIVHIYSLDSFGVPYFNISNYSDLKDLFIRSPIWKMNKRPSSIPNNDPVRQKDFRNKFRRKPNEEGGK